MGNSNESANARETRYFPRRKVILRGHINVKTYEFGCDLVNLSLGGAMVKLELPITIDTSVELEIKGCPPLPASIVWAQDGRMGLRFTVDPGKVRRALGRLGETLPSGLADKLFEQT